MQIEYLKFEIIKFLFFIKINVIYICLLSIHYYLFRYVASKKILFFYLQNLNYNKIHELQLIKFK